MQLETADALLEGVADLENVVESPDLAQENIHSPINQLADEDDSYTTAPSE